LRRIQLATPRCFAPPLLVDSSRSARPDWLMRPGLAELLVGRQLPARPAASRTCHTTGPDETARHTSRPCGREPDFTVDLNGSDLWRQAFDLPRT
jgi:hypothetical protein